MTTNKPTPTVDLDQVYDDLVDAANADKWDTLTQDERLTVTIDAGWASRTARRLSRHSWSDLSPAARNVLSRKWRIDP